jgi:hypothetical protein
MFLCVDFHKADKQTHGQKKGGVASTVQDKKVDGRKSSKNWNEPLILLLSSVIASTPTARQRGEPGTIEHHGHMNTNEPEQQQ